MYPFQLEVDESPSTDEVSSTMLAQIVLTLTSANALNDMLKRHNTPTKPLNLAISTLNALSANAVNHKDVSEPQAETAAKELSTAKHLLDRLLKSARGYQRQRLLKFVRAEQATLWRVRKFCDDARRALDNLVQSVDDGGVDNYVHVQTLARQIVDEQRCQQDGDQEHGKDDHDDHHTDEDEDDMPPLVEDPNLLPSNSTGMPLVETGNTSTDRVQSTTTTTLYGQVTYGETNNMQIRVPNVSLPCGAAIASIALSSRYVFAGTEDGDVHVADLSEKRLIYCISCFDLPVTAVTFTDDQSLLVAGSKSGEAGVWRITDGVPVSTFLGMTAAIRKIHVLQDQKSCAMEAADNCFNVWMFDSPEPMLENKFQGGATCQVHIGQDGKPASFSGHYDTMSRNWDEEKGLNVVVLGHGNSPIEFMRAYGNYVLCQTWTDGAEQRMVIGCVDGVVRVMDDQVEVCKLKKVHDGPVRCVVITDDGKRFVSGAESGDIVVWDVNEVGYLYSRLGGHTNAVTSVGISDDGEVIVSGSQDGTIRIWEYRVEVGLEAPTKGKKGRKGKKGKKSCRR